jgi:amidase
MTLTDDFSGLDATAQAELVRNGGVSALELVDAAIARIEKFDPQLNAVIHRRFERVRAEALRGLPDGPFTGVPFLLKDGLCQLEGEPQHAGMQVLKQAGYRSDHDSYLGARYRRAGFAICGKTNLPELALSPVTEPVAYGPTRNPWDLERNPGGSSGGAAAAVAAGLVPVAHGNDMGGSIRIPASMCGLVGLKPSRGRTTIGPDFGEYWGQMTHEHVLTRSVRDSALVLDACAGAAPGDPYTAPPPERAWRDELGTEPGSLRIGFRTRRTDGQASHPECVAAVESAVSLLSELGHQLEDDSPAHLEDAAGLGAYMPMLATHVASELDRVGGLVGRKLTQDDVEPATWSLAEAGRAVGGLQLLAATAELHRYARGLAEWWTSGFDVLLTPTLAGLPPRIGASRSPSEIDSDTMQFVTFTMPFNISGQPAISLPLYWSAEGLPVGVQFVADYGREDLLFRLAAQIETARPWAFRWPKLVG